MNELVTLCVRVPSSVKQSLHDIATTSYSSVSQVARKILCNESNKDTDDETTNR